MSLHRRLLAVLSVAALLCAATVLVLAWTARSAVPLPERADALSRELRCPVCSGETIADSQSDVAVAMRAEVVDQLARGQSPEQVRTWFAQRYGADVVLRPAADRAGLVVWLLPAVVLAAGVVVVARRVGPAPEGSGRRPRLVPGVLALTAGLLLAAPAWSASRQDGPAAPAAQDGGAALETLRAGGSAGDGDSWVALGRTLTEQGRHAEAVDAYRAAVAHGVPEQAVRPQLGLALLRADRAAEAVPLLRAVLADRPDEPDALLMLAAALRDESPDEARSLLRRFLTVAPDHVAAPGVRSALGEDEQP